MKEGQEAMMKAVDELGDIRAQIRNLKVREEKLRTLLLTQQAPLEGDRYRASIRDAIQTRVDPEAVRRHVGAEAYKTLVKVIDVITVKVEPK